MIPADQRRRLNALVTPPASTTVCTAHRQRLLKSSLVCCIQDPLALAWAQLEPSERAEHVGADVSIREPDQRFGQFGDSVAPPGSLGCGRATSKRGDSPLEASESCSRRPTGGHATGRRVYG